MCGVVITQKLATLQELQTIYSIEDLYILYDIVATNSINQHIANNVNR